MSRELEVDFGAVAPPGYVTQSSDTPYWAERLMFKHLASLTPDEKIEAIRSFHRAAHRIQLSGLARRFPDATPEQLELRAAEVRLGRDVVQRALALAARQAT